MHLLQSAQLTAALYQSCSIPALKIQDRIIDNVIPFSKKNKNRETMATNTDESRDIVIFAEDKWKQKRENNNPFFVFSLSAKTKEGGTFYLRAEKEGPPRNGRIFLRLKSITHYRKSVAVINYHVDGNVIGADGKKGLQGELMHDHFGEPVLSLFKGERATLHINKVSKISRVN